MAARPLNGNAGAAVEPATWATWREARAILARPRNLRRTAAIALVVGTVLFCINQLDVVLRGEADAVVWIKVAVTFLVPFCVSCAGVLVGTRRPPGPAGPPEGPKPRRRAGRSLTAAGPRRTGTGAAAVASDVYAMCPSAQRRNRATARWLGRRCANRRSDRFISCTVSA
jgi:hypothetical protein